MQTDRVSASWIKTGEFTSQQLLQPGTQYNYDLSNPQLYSDSSEYSFRLSHLQVCLLATVLEDIITNMHILDECNNQLRIEKLNAEMDVHLAKKYGVKVEEKKDELDGIDVKNIKCEDHKIKKLEADRVFTKQVFTDLYMDLVLNTGYQSGRDHIKRILDQIDFYDNLIVDETRNKQLKRELNRQLRQLRNHIKSTTYDTDAAIELLKCQVEDAALNAATKTRYIENWQIARMEQHEHMIEEKEKPPTLITEEYKMKVDQENRVHTEMELLVTILTNETLSKVESWMDKYEKDTEKLDLSIRVKKNDYERTLDRRINLENTLEKRAADMHNWVHFKEERERQRLYRESMNKSAVTIQAWWRGLLVRQNLGPFKVAKKRGGGKGDKKK